MKSQQCTNPVGLLICVVMLVYRGGSLHPVTAGRGDQLVAPTQSGQMVAELVRTFCRPVLGQRRERLPVELSGISG